LRLSQTFIASILRLSQFSIWTIISKFPSHSDEHNAKRSCDTPENKEMQF
jgi:hypothetical protein